ncbi:hypothetical protein RCJ22_13520 [Vibrio sp. FNV 38]|nr:hypothetical protein [Vibrio sp. FNV 38]
MKFLKSVVCLIPICLLSSHVSATEVYNSDGFALNIGGLFEPRMQYNSVIKERDDQSTTDLTQSRLNVGINQQISDGIKAIAFREDEWGVWGYELRHMYGGFDIKNHRIIYGKAAGSMGVVTGQTDFLPTYGNRLGSKINTADREKNNLVYLGRFYGGKWRIKAHYNGGGTMVKNAANRYLGYDPLDKDIMGNVDIGYGFATDYVFNYNFKAALGYSYEELRNIRGTEANDGTLPGGLVKGGSAINDQAHASIRYRSKSMMLAGLVVNGRGLSQRYFGFEVAARYNITPKLLIGASYTVNKFDDMWEAGERADISMGYNFTPRINAYVGYSKTLSHNKLELARVGMKFRF